MNTILLLFFVLCVTTAATLALSLRRVPEGSVCTVHRFGRYVRTLTPGWHFTLAPFDKIAHKVNLMGHQIDLPGATGMGAQGAVYYQILEPQRTGPVLDEVDSLVQREASAQLAALWQETRLDEPAALATRLKDRLNRQLGRLGLLVIRCQVHISS